MKQSLKARLEQLGPIQVITPIRSGSPAVMILRQGTEPARINSIAAIHSLVRRGVKLRSAKRAIKAMIAKGESIVHVPTVESGNALKGELLKAGVAPSRVAAEPVNIRDLRERLNMTQEEFALRYNLNLRALQNWEQGRDPEPVVWSYLKAIEQNPKGVAAALEDA